MTDAAAAPSTLVLLAAAFLRIPARRLRALACGDDGALRDWLANESATRLAEARRDARLALARIDRCGARVVALGDEAYPAGLRDLRDAPPYLIVRGRLARASRPGGTAIVGAREPDARAETFARALAASGVATPIVSGLALGIDAAAHRGALAAGVATLAYVGHGLGATYPPEHRALEDEIVAAGGAVLSESLPDERATRWSLVRRDRLQAAHASSIVLVASACDGGAMHALAAARALGRPRFALEPPCDGCGTDDGASDAYGGNRRAIAEGAHAVPDDAGRARASVRAAARDPAAGEPAPYRHVSILADDGVAQRP
ncbi:MAG: hypothetical protein NVSMB21_14370 [Vulcanimicrobiaceae bacterium]